MNSGVTMDYLGGGNGIARVSCLLCYWRRFIARSVQGGSE